MGYAGKVRQGLILNRTFDGKSNALPRHRLGSADIITNLNYLSISLSPTLSKEKGLAVLQNQPSL